MLFQILKKAYLRISKYLAQFFCSSLFQILKKYTFYTYLLFLKKGDKYRKHFYNIKNYRHLSEIEIEEIRKNFNKLEKSLNFKKPRNNINSIHYEDLDKDKDPDGEDADDDKYRKIGSVRRLFKRSNRGYYKPAVIDRGFAGEVNNYIKYRSEGIKMKNYHLKNILI